MTHTNEVVHAYKPTIRYDILKIVLPIAFTILIALIALISYIKIEFIQILIQNIIQCVSSNTVDRIPRPTNNDDIV